MSSSQRSRLFREVNDRIYDLLETVEPDLQGEFFCECGRDCDRRVELLPAVFAELRDTGRGVRSVECRGTTPQVATAASSRPASRRRPVSASK